MSYGLSIWGTPAPLYTNQEDDGDINDHPNGIFALKRVTVIAHTNTNIVHCTNLNSLTIARISVSVGAASIVDAIKV